MEIMENVRITLLNLCNGLYGHFGPQRWWPGETPFEVMVGAVLTQNTNWRNVERAIANLKKADLLHPQRLAGLRLPRLARLIRPAGYFNVKAKRLKAFVRWLVLIYLLIYTRLLQHSSPASQMYLVPGQYYLTQRLYPSYANG